MVAEGLAHQSMDACTPGLNPACDMFTKQICMNYLNAMDNSCEVKSTVALHMRVSNERYF